MCPCYVGYFHEEGNEYVKKLCHFYCKCKDDHQYFVHTCKSHLCIYKRLDGMQLNCTCKDLGPYEIFNFWVQLKYLINFRVYKICMKNIPANISQHLVPLNNYLKNELTKCEQFFYFFNQKVNIKLDNPLEKYMNNIRKVD